MHKPLLALAAAAIALLVAPAMAAAAADGTISLDGTARYAWSGGPGDGLLPFAADQVGVGPVSQDGFSCGDPTYDCETKLIKVDSPGDLTFELHGQPGDTPDALGVDLDAFLYASDANGTQGEELATGVTSTADEVAIANGVEPGYYLAKVVYYAAVNATYDASATISVPVPEDEGEDEGAAARAASTEPAWGTSAPARHKALTAEAPKFDWTGTGTGILFDCGTAVVNPCDFTLVHIDEPGDLQLDIAGTPTNVWDYVQLFESDKNGTKIGDALIDEGDPTTSGTQSGAALGLDKGYYLIQMGWLVAAKGDYAGSIVFTPTPPEEETE